MEKKLKYQHDVDDLVMGSFLFETIDALGITRLENNHTSNPRVNRGILNVAIRGGPKFPNE